MDVRYDWFFGACKIIIKQNISHVIDVLSDVRTVFSIK